MKEDSLINIETIDQLKQRNTIILIRKISVNLLKINSYKIRLGMIN